MQTTCLRCFSLPSKLKIMNNSSSHQHRITFLTWLRFLFITLLVLGIFFRFANIERKLYWGDEVVTSLRISGYTLAEMNQNLWSGRVVGIEDLQKYQYPSPEKTAIDTIKGIALEESQVVPLYFVLARFWVQLFGNSVTVTRSFSVFLSLLTFPCLYWLSQELFKSSLISWIAIILVAVSPFHVLYAQEARPYSLWIVMILLSSATLLRAMRLKTKASWGIYALTMTLGLYTQVLFGLVAIGHGIYIIVSERLRLSKTLISYLLASFVGFLPFIPWLLVMIYKPAESTINWTNTKSSFFSSLARWSGIVSRVFLDLGVGPDDSLKRLIPLVPFILILLALISYSIYFLYRQTPQRVWLFVLTLIGVTAIAFIIPDFVLGKRYGTTRFITPCILGIQLSLAHLLAAKNTSFFISNQRKKVWEIVAFMVVLSGVISCTISSQAEMWWNKAPDKNKDSFPIAEIVNKANQPLLIKDGDLIPVQVLGYLLAPKVRFQLSKESDIPKIPDGFTDVFLFQSSESLRSGLERVYNSKIKLINGALGKLIK
jgi:uncharacterized membrane protein